MKALTFSSFGSSDVLEYTDVPKPKIKVDELLIKNHAIGLNYADVYRRKGNYHLKGEPPYIAGYEGAGIVEESNTKDFKPGDRIAYVDVPYSNAEYIAVPVTHAIPLPDKISFETAASVLLQGLTAQYLCTDSYDVQKGDTILIHAASGGVGQFLTQLCRAKGSTVIGLTRSKRKLETILSAGANHALLLDDKWKTKVLDITDSLGVHAVFDSVGSTLNDSFDVTRDTGTVVFYGMSGGDPDPVDPRMLMDTSKRLVGGDLWSYLVNQIERRSRALSLFNQLIDGQLRLKKPEKFALSDGAQAHDYLENGKSSGKILLIP